MAGPSIAYAVWWDGGQIERVKACLNGGRQHGEHPVVPINRAGLAREAAGAVAAGAEAVHLHPRGAGGAESLAAARSRRR